MFVNLHSHRSCYSCFSLREFRFPVTWFPVCTLQSINVLFLRLIANDKRPQPHFLLKFTHNPYRLPGGPQSQEAHQVVVSEPDPEAESRPELPHAGGGTSSGDGHTRRDVWGTLRVPNTNQQPTASYSLDSCAFTRLVWIKQYGGINSELSLVLKILIYCAMCMCTVYMYR